MSKNEIDQCVTETSSDGAIEVYFDGACPVCRREIAMYRNMVERDAVVWSDVSEATEMAASDLSREDALARFHVRRADGTLVSGAAAFVVLWHNMDGFRTLAWILDRRPFMWLAELCYRLFLRVRKVWRPTKPREHF